MKSFEGAEYYVILYFPLNIESALFSEGSHYILIIEKYFTGQVFSPQQGKPY